MLVIMAGAASTNGLLFVLAILLVLAWKTAGYLGLDYSLLPLLGTRWRRTRPAAPLPVVAATRLQP